MTKVFAVALTALWLASSVVDAPAASDERSGMATVSGQVVVRAAPAPPPTSMGPYSRRRATPPQNAGTPGGAEDAFVYLEPVDAPAPPAPAAAAEIVQRDRTIMPHVSVVRVGQLVEFPNEDDVFHNLFSLSPGNRFSLGRYAPEVTETHTFEAPGVVRLFCDIHAEMAGVILVVESPYVARVGPDGSYEIADVPAGSYRAIGWHPTAGADTTAVEVQAGGTSVDFFLGG